MMGSIDDYQLYPYVKQSTVRKLTTYASSLSSNSSNSSTTYYSPNTVREKFINFDTDEGYASFTTSSTAFISQRSNNANRDDSAYGTSSSERLPTSHSLSRAHHETDSDKSELSDDEPYVHHRINRGTAEDLVDWGSLNQQVQTLVTRLDTWLHQPLPDRSIPVENSSVDHAYPILQRRTTSVPLAIDLASDQHRRLPHHSDYVLDFVQNPTIARKKSNEINRSCHDDHEKFIPKLEHCANCSRLINLLSTSSQQRSIIRCLYCEQTYCSKHCQKSDWPIHKRRCTLSNSYSCCGHILRLMKSNGLLLKRLSTLASTGYLSSGRGAVLLYFDSMSEADAYAYSLHIENTRLMAIYCSLNDPKTNRAIDYLRSSEYDHLEELTMIYDPTTEFVCHVTIRVEESRDHTRYHCVSRSMVFKLSENMHPTPILSSTYPTLFFSSINYNSGDENNSHMRHVFFAKLQTELRERGIEIEEHYPELYNKLCDYISNERTDHEKLYPFTPICLFMRHRQSEQLFMCVITPESEPDRSWLLDRCRIEKKLLSSD